MFNLTQSVIERFPENGAVVHNLLQQNHDFENLCREYAQFGIDLEELVDDPSPEAVKQAIALRNRRLVIEEEILTAIEGYSPH